MAKSTSNQNSKNQDLSPMAQLLAGSSTKKLNLNRGDIVEGKVIAISPEEVILDLGIKSEGVINKRDLLPEKLAGLKIGDSLKAYVYMTENQSGQVVLTLFESSVKGNFQLSDKNKAWQKFIRALEQKSHLNGRVMDVNKGGLVVEVDNIRGFLPVSQMSLDKVAGEGLSGMVGKDISVSVLEVDPSNNRLIFSSRKQLSVSEKDALSKFQVGEVKKMKIGAVTPIGLLGDLEGENTEGFVPVYEASWEKIEDLNTIYKVGDEIEVKVLGTDETLGRVNLSIKQLKEDPWEKEMSGYQVDDVISGTVTEVTQNGVKVALEKAEGFVANENIEPGTKFEIGQKTNFLVAGLDKKKRLVLLSPFLTSTTGLIYK